MVKITADSTCDITPELISDMGIELVPLHIVVGDEDFKDGVDIKPADIFEYVDGEGKSCNTAAVNIYEYMSVFEKYADGHDALIHICISSDFSSCYQNAVIAAQSFDNVFIIDSRSLSSGSGHLVYDAALMAKAGMKAEEICSNLEETIPRIEASFVIDRLDYLYKGGRCSGLEAVGAKLLQIKPCIEVIDGKMIVGKKYRGSFESCLDKYVKDRVYEKNDIDYSRVFITHPMCSEEMVAKVKEALMRYADFDEIIETNAGCTVSSHCGPNTLGIMFKRTASV